MDYFRRSNIMCCSNVKFVTCVFWSLVDNVIIYVGIPEHGVSFGVNIWTSLLVYGEWLRD